MSVQAATISLDVPARAMFAPRSFGSGLAATLLLAAALSAVSLNVAAPAGDPREFIYIQKLTHDSVVVAWGGPSRAGDNTIGESSPPVGPAELRVFYRATGRPIPGSPFRTNERNWKQVSLPQSSTEYGYDLQVDERPWGDAIYREEQLLYFRSSPGPTESSGSLAFLVLGDFGTASEKQFRLAEAMRRVVEEQESAGRPIRYLLSTGDNFYDYFLFIATGSDDKEFYRKFFIPYQRLLSRIPFLPALGNHDGSESESASDLAHYRDNFFLPRAVLPGGTPSDFEDRFYSVGHGKDVRLICLDSTSNQETLTGLGWQPIYGDGGRSEQRVWLEAELERSRGAVWKIAWFHHPPFNAGSGHYGARSKDRNLRELERDLVPLIAKGGVRVVFSGHVHNFQITREEANGPLSQTRYLVTGAGGKSERGRRGSSGLQILRSEGIAATNVDNRAHFLLVEIDGDRMEVTPLTYDANGDPTPLAIRTADNEIYSGLREPFSILRGGNEGDENNGGSGPTPYHPIVIRARPK